MTRSWRCGWTNGQARSDPYRRYRVRASGPRWNPRSRSTPATGLSSTGAPFHVRTVRVLVGPYADQIPISPLHCPDRTVTDLAALPNVLASLG